MRRRVFKFGAGVSLLFFLATLVLWVRSNWRSDSFGYVGHYRWYTKSDRLTTAVNTFPGVMWVYIDDQVVVEGTPRGFFCGTGPSEQTPHWLRLDPPKLGGFDYDVGEPLWLLVPFWMPAAATGLLPTVWLLVWVVKLRMYRTRQSGGHCVSCGYSLTGNASGTCPECGTAILQASRPA